MASGQPPPFPPLVPDPSSYPPSWNGGTRTVYEPPRPRAPKPKIWLHLLLFLLTVGTTTTVYALGSGSWAQGAIYSACVLSILTAHEFGHYFAARYHQVPTTLPYFIPMPLPPLGTLGAVIRMSPFIPDRRALFDIAAAGPIAGLVLALPITLVGIAFSQRVSIEGLDAMMLGDTLLFRALEWLVFGARAPNTDVLLHPAAFAGWVGLFVTALNLLPISQLDGGHVSYALLGRRSRAVAMVSFLLLLTVTLIMGFHYSVMLVLLWFMGISHPPTLNDSLRLDQRRRRIGIALAIIFVLCFTPAPFAM
jgi:Zn-dependent protease